jgi:sodium transport system ATP-binding protein
MIKTSNVSKTFYDQKRGAINAVVAIELNIEKGEVFGLLGPNGAGKTTFLRMLSTVLSPTTGSISINNFKHDTQATEIKKSIGFISGNTKLYGRLTPKELLVYFGNLYDMTKDQIKSRSEIVIEMLGMSEFMDQRIESLSTGQSQKTSIARCIIHDPPVFILDEPTLGLDILTSRSILNFIKEASGNGKTIILSTHYMGEAEQLCSRIGFMSQGKLLAINTLSGFQNEHDTSNLSEIFLKYTN